MTFNPPQMPNKEHYFLTAIEFYNPERGEFFGKPVPNGVVAHDESFVAFKSVNAKISSIRIPMMFCVRDLTNVKETLL